MEQRLNRHYSIIQNIVVERRKPDSTPAYNETLLCTQPFKAEIQILYRLKIVSGKV